MYCANCGNKLGQKEKVCRKCGQVVTKSDQKSALFQKNKIWLIGALATVIIVASIILIAIQLRSRYVSQGIDSIIETPSQDIRDHAQETETAEISENDNSIEAESRYQEALALLESAQYDDAAEQFDALGDYSDSAERASQARYAKAEALLEAGDLYGAATTFGGITEYKDAWERSSSLWANLTNRDTLAALYYYSYAINSDGTLSIAGGVNEDKNVDSELSKLTGLIDIDGAYQSLIALQSDGTVSVGPEWKDIVAVAGSCNFDAGLKADGTVITTDGWFQEASDWTSIIDISAGTYQLVGLKSDGTVVAFGGEDGESEVGNWHNIIAIAAGEYHTVGLKADGSVIAIGWNGYGQTDVLSWKNIVAVSAGWKHTVGLKKDGTVVAAGDNERKQCNVKNWRNIVAICAGTEITLGLRADGTVVATGWDEVNQCHVDSWKDIMIPDTVVRGESFQQVQAEDSDKNSDYKISTDGDTAIITSYIGFDSDVVIPAVINNCKVVGIGESAFIDRNITSIVIPEGVTEIGAYAFTGCIKLKSVSLPDTIRSIGESAFAGCIKLSSIEIPYGVEYLSNHLFSACTGLRRVTLPDSIIGIGNEVFYGCNDIKYITSPDFWDRVMYY